MAEDKSLSDIAAEVGPKRVTVDGETVESHSIADLLAAKREDANDNASSPNFGLRFARMVPPGTG